MADWHTTAPQQPEEGEEQQGDEGDEQEGGRRLVTIGWLATTHAQNKQRTARRPHSCFCYPRAAGRPSAVQQLTRKEQICRKAKI